MRLARPSQASLNQTSVLCGAATDDITSRRSDNGRGVLESPSRGGKDSSESVRTRSWSTSTQNATTQEEPSVVTPKSLTSAENNTGVSAQSISVPDGLGTIEGMEESFSAQTFTGVAGFTFPFALPAARGAGQASLGLSYPSGEGSSVARPGWSIGVAFIARQTDQRLLRYNEQSTWHPGQDWFVYSGGQELVPVTQLLSGEADVVHTTGTAVEVWFALGRYPGGDERSGTTTWTSKSTDSPSMAPVQRCLPYGGTPGRFSDGDTHCRYEWRWVAGYCACSST